MTRDDIEADIAVIGAGPAGLAAAEAASKAGARTVVFDWMPSPGRKFLMAGKSGLNLTNLEPLEQFLPRFGPAALNLAPILTEHPPSTVIEWCEALGQPTFIGGGGRAFPKSMKASPLLRAWLARLQTQGVILQNRWRWTGWRDGGPLTFETPAGLRQVRAGSTILAAGGASWPRLGSDGVWCKLLPPSIITPFTGANVGWETSWSAWFRDHFSGAPVKATALRIGSSVNRGEWVITREGVEGGAIYTLGAALRQSYENSGAVRLSLDLAPDRPEDRLTAELARRPRKESLSTRLRKAARLDGVKAALLRETHPDIAGLSSNPAALAAAIKSAPLTLNAPRPIAEAISSAGGVRWNALDGRLMLKDYPGVFCAGEMIDWDAPTGGYLLSACLATGWHAGDAAADWVNARGAKKEATHA